MKASRIALIITLVFNLWIWRIISENLIVAIIVIINTLLLFSLLHNENSFKSLKVTSLFYISFAFLVGAQFLTTKPASLTALSADEYRIVEDRILNYPILKLPLGYWLEQKQESIALSRIQNNVFENIDPNLYFFAGSPRQRLGIKEFEKFPYIFLPFFLYGIFTLIKTKLNLPFLSVYLVPLVLSGIIGNKNEMGLFSVFPLLVVSTSTGLTSLMKHKRGFYVFLAILILVFIQIISYEQAH